MTEIQIVKTEDPTKIPDEKIKAYMLAHKLPAIDAFKDLLSQDLLERLEHTTDESLKPIVKILIQQVVGNGVKTNARNGSQR